MQMKSLTVLALGLILALAPTLAEARPGGGGSMGSRGARTYSAPPSTRTAPAPASPIQRSVTPETAPSPQAAPVRPTAPIGQPQPSFAQRNPFMTGLLGGLVGAGIAGMLFGHGFGLGGGGGAAGLGLLLQLLLIGGLGWLAFSWFRQRRGSTPMTYAAPAAMGPSPGYSYIPDTGSPQMSLPPGGGTAQPAGRDGIGLGNSDFDDFEKLLVSIQTAWSNGDIAALRRHVTPEMLSYFAEQLATNTSKGVTNVIQDVSLEQGDLSEAWREGDIDYATVALGYSLIDYTVDENSRVVAGDKTNRQRVTELWTYMRQAGGGRWLLSAIQQA
jgi:predicted lipid-binding transport protein (Tim44 family)